MKEERVEAMQCLEGEDSRHSKSRSPEKELGRPEQLEEKWTGSEEEMKLECDLDHRLTP